MSSICWQTYCPCGVGGTPRGEAAVVDLVRAYRWPRSHLVCVADEWQNVDKRSELLLTVQIQCRRTQMTFPP
jgi:hypothetical protein